MNIRRKEQIKVDKSSLASCTNSAIYLAVHIRTKIDSPSQSRPFSFYGHLSERNLWLHFAF